MPFTSLRSAAVRIWWLPVTLLASMSALQALGFVAPLRYERAAVAAGEWWRLFTGHLVHLGGHHLLMNMLALFLLWLLFGPLRSGRQWLAILCVTMLGIGGGLYLLDPGLRWYVGFSGVLHGIYAAGVVGRWPQQRVSSLLLAAALVTKLGWEQFTGGAAATAAFVGGAVVVDAHLYGAVSGAAVALALAWHGRRRAAFARRGIPAAGA